MRQAFASTALTAGFVTAHSLQHVISDESNVTPRLNFSSSSPLIFHATFGLLQQWPNTFFPNGHTIAPCTVPKNTNLYHARWDADLPPSPEWFAFDAEMSYWVAGFSGSSQLLTYRTTKEVKCLYFDGTSASLMNDGSMDSQMVFIHNSSANVPDSPRFGGGPPSRGDDGPYDGPGNSHSTADEPPWKRPNRGPLAGEYDRADGLCGFIQEKNLGGRGWGYEGVVRMNAGFEIIWCNFTSPSANLVSHLNISSPMLDDWPHSRDLTPFSGSMDEAEPIDDRDGPPGTGGPPERGRRPDRGRPPNPLPFRPYATYQWFDAAAKRYGFNGGFPGRGEARVKIDSCGIFSFYDPSLSNQNHARIVSERKSYNLTEEGYWRAPKDNSERQVALQSLSRRRRAQRSVNVSEADGLYMRSMVENSMRASLEPVNQRCSGSDWPVTAQEIVMRYSSDLHELAGLLSSNVSSLPHDNFITWLTHVRVLAHNLWMPFYEYPPYDKKHLDRAFSTSAPQSQAALQLCIDRFAPLDPSELSASENTTYAAISDTTTAICSTLLPLFMTTERVWLANYNNASDYQSSRSHSRSLQSDTARAVQHHLPEIEELMAWLGWADQWTSCSPGCALGQVCYIPIWPVQGVAWGTSGPPDEPRVAADRGYGGPGGPGGRENRWEELLWEPKCVDAEHFPPQ